jgi:hypothetical protein
LRSTVLDDADNLMAWNQRPFQRWKFAFDEVKIGTANTAGANAKEDFASDWLRFGSLFNLKWLFGGFK